MSLLMSTCKATSRPAKLGPDQEAGAILLSPSSTDPNRPVKAPVSSDQRWWSKMTRAHAALIVRGPRFPEGVTPEIAGQTAWPRNQPRNTDRGSWLPTLVSVPPPRAVSTQYGHMSVGSQTRKIMTANGSGIFPSSLILSKTTPTADKVW